MIKVCEHEIKCCPYCGSKKIQEQPKLKPLVALVHVIECKRCLGVFFVPCED